jgi:FAD:protein FMN transferase
VRLALDVVPRGGSVRHGTKPREGRARNGAESRDGRDGQAARGAEPRRAESRDGGVVDTVDHVFAALGTEVRIVVTDPRACALVGAAEAEVLDYDARLSRFRADSELCALNADPRNVVPASALLREAVRCGLWAARRTGGLVDPCLLDALEAAGYRSSLAGSRREPAGVTRPAVAWPARPHPARRWRSVRVDDERGVVLRPAGLRLDLGGTRKGHVADRVAALLAPARAWAVDCGGDVRVGGRTGAPHAVDVGHPLGGAPVARLRLTSGAVATSSILARAWTAEDGTERHHLLDPATGAPAHTGLVAATAIGRTTLEAETLAKAALLSGPGAGADLLAHHGGLLVDAAGAVRRVDRATVGVTRREARAR